MGRTSWADGEILLASSAERRAASALVLVEPVGGVGPLTRRLPRHAYAGCSTNPLIGHANIPSAHKLQPDAAHSAPTQPTVIKRKSRCSKRPHRGVGCVYSTLPTPDRKMALSCIWRFWPKQRLVERPAAIVRRQPPRAAAHCGV
jgi:hypothetical protein